MKIRILRFLALSVISLFALGVILDLQTPKQMNSQSQTPVTEVKPVSIDELFKLTNDERSKAGLTLLTLDKRLNASAQMKADEMQRTKVYSHVNPDGKHGYEYIHEQGIEGCSIGSENILLYKYFGSSTAKRAIDSWMESESHRNAILDKKAFSVGFGYNGKYTVQHFCEVE